MEVVVARFLIGLVIVLIGAAFWFFAVSTNHGCYPWQGDATRPHDAGTKVRHAVCR